MHQYRVGFAHCRYYSAIHTQKWLKSNKSGQGRKEGGGKRRVVRMKTEIQEDSSAELSAAKLLLNAEVPSLIHSSVSHFHSASPASSIHSLCQHGHAVIMLDCQELWGGFTYKRDKYMMACQQRNSKCNKFQGRESQSSAKSFFFSVSCRSLQVPGPLLEQHCEFKQMCLKTAGWFNR